MSHAPTIPVTPRPAAIEPTSFVSLYQQMWRHAQGARVRLCAALTLLASSQLLKLAMPWLAAQAINTIQTQGRAGLLAAGGWIAAVFGLHLLSWALHGPGRVLERGVALRVRRSVADGLYERVVGAPLSWHDAHHSGDVQHRVVQASEALGGFTQSQFIYLQNFINVAGPLVALFLLSRWTGSLAIVGFVLVGVAIVFFDRALMRLAEQENRAERRYVARLIDFVGNISAIASLRLQQASRRLLDSRLLDVFGPLGRSIALNEGKWCAVDLLTVALSWGLVVIYALSVPSTAAGGALLIGSLFMVHQYAQQASGVLGSMAANYASLARTQTDFASADVIRAAPQAAVRVAAPDSPWLAWQRIELQQLGFAYPVADRGGLVDVTLALRRGERVALVGPSGSGKSTLLRVIAGLHAAQSGQLLIDGQPQPGRRDVAELCTLIPQEADVFEASVRENITFDEPATEAALQRAVHVSVLDEVLTGLPQGLGTPISQRGLNLSGGQRQRLALARAVLAAGDSSLLLLDEPTSALDALTEQRVHQRLGVAFAGACIVCAVHRMGLLEHFDRVVFMAEGRIVDTGTPDEVAARQPGFAAMRAGVVDAGGAG